MAVYDVSICWYIGVAIAVDLAVAPDLCQAQGSRCSYKLYNNTVNSTQQWGTNYYPNHFPLTPKHTSMFLILINASSIPPRARAMRVGEGVVERWGVLQVEGWPLGRWEQ